MAHDDPTAHELRLGEEHPPHAEAVVSRRAASGRRWVALAAVLWSSSGLFAKAPLFDDWPLESRGLLLAFWRALFAGVLLLPAVKRPRWNWRLAPLCATFAVMNASYLTALTMATAASAIWLQSTAPWWVFLAGFFVGGEKLPRADRIPLVLGGIGLAVILSSHGQEGARWGVVWGLLSGITYAGVVLSLRWLRDEESVWLVSITHLVTAVALLPVAIYLNHWPSGGQLLVLAAFGLFQMALPYVCFARGLQTITSQEATAIGLLEPLLLPLWVYLAWGEVPALATMLGGGLIFLSLLLRYSLPLVARH